MSVTVRIVIIQKSNQIFSKKIDRPDSEAPCQIEIYFDSRYFQIP